ncbi:MAG: TetR family transcriptional regulator [Pseudomonadota bacterium]
MSTDTTVATRSGPRPSTSRQEIVQCALRMLDREGPETLTFRAVARELDMTVGALSRYFKNLVDLEDEVAAQIMSELRPLEAKSKSSVRDQLLRMSMDLLEICRAHPYLVKIHGPASARVSAKQTKQSMKVMLDAGIEFDRAMAIYSLVGSMPSAWATAIAQPSNPEQTALIAQAYMDEIGEFAPQMNKLVSSTATGSVYKRWLTIYLDALLAVPPPNAKKS